MGYTYTSFVAELALMTQFSVTDPNFVGNLPTCIDYATDRITRELDLLNTVTATSTPTLTVGSRVLDLSALSPVFNVIRDLNVITPFGTTDPNLGTRNALTIQSLAFMNWTYGASPTVGGLTGVPQYFAMFTDQTLRVGPYPDKAYNVEVIGTVRPTELNAANPTGTNWIATYIPDLFMAAAMIQMAGFKMNYGAQSDDPQQAVSWEDQYKLLRDSAGVEDAMRRYYATGYCSQLPSAYTPART